MAGAGGAEVGRISIRVVPDLDRFHRDLKAKLEELEKTLKGEIPIEAQLDTLKARGDMATLMAKLKADASRGVTIKADVDRGVIDRFRDTISKGLAGASGAAGSLGGMSRGLMIAAAVAAFAAPALALVSGALVAMPALISALLVPIGALVLGFEGIKKAAEVLAEPFSRLKATMSQRFQENFTPIFKNLLRIFPVLEESLPKVADGLSAIAASFVDTVTSQAGLEKIRGIISNIADFMKGLAPGVGKVTDGLLGLANGVSAKFPAVSKWFEKVGTSFDKWVEKISAPSLKAGGKSPLDTAMENLGVTAKGLFDILGDLAKTGFDFLADPKFGESMKNFVTSCQTLINNVLPSLKQFFIDISDSLTTITTAMDRFKDWKKPDWLDKLNGKEDKSLPTPQEDFDGSGPGAKNILELPDFGPIKAAYAELMLFIKTGMGEALTFAFATVPAAAATAFQNVQSIAAAAFNGVVSTVASVMSAVISQFARVPGALGAAWGAIPGIAAGVWNQVVSVVASALASVVAAVVAGGAQAVAEIASWPGRFVAALGSLYDAFYNAGVEAVNGLIQGITSMIGGAIAAASNLAGQVASAVAGALDINSPSKVIRAMGESVGEGMTEGIKNSTKEAVEAAAKMAAGVADAAKVETAAGTASGSGFDSKKLFDMGEDFVTANANQLMSDLGIGGNGAISQALKQGLGFAKQTIFNVSSSDEAIAIDKNQTAKDSLQYWRR